MIVLNIIIFSIILFIVLIAYIKILYPFWNIQPVYHKYDYWRSLYIKPFIVYKHIPIKTKFCDFDTIKTIEYLECSQTQKEELVNLIQCYYMPTERLLYTIDGKNIDSYMTGAGEPSYISFYNQKIYDISGDIICYNKPIACICSRHLKFFYRDGPFETVYRELSIYFIDLLCVQREQNIVNISRKLLQTHEYNQRIKNPNITVSLLKKEVELFNGVVPLVSYNTSTYSIRNIEFSALPNGFHIILINKENIDLLIDFIHIQTHYYYQKDNPCIFDICIIADIASLIDMINQKILYVFCLRNGEHIYGYYFIKDAKTQYEDLIGDGGETGHTLHCISSMMNMESNHIFYLGFLHSLYSILKLNKKFKILLFDEIGHNVRLLQYWKRKFSPVFTTPSAYYLYNMIFPNSPVDSDRCLIVI